MSHREEEMGIAREKPFLGVTPPQHPDCPPHAQTSSSSEAGGTQAQGGLVAKGRPAEPPRWEAPSERPHCGDSAGSQLVPGPPSKPERCCQGWFLPSQEGQPRGSERIFSNTHRFF